MHIPYENRRENRFTIDKYIRGVVNIIYQMDLKVFPSEH